MGLKSCRCKHQVRLGLLVHCQGSSPSCMLLICGVPVFLQGFYLGWCNVFILRKYIQVPNSSLKGLLLSSERLSACAELLCCVISSSSGTNFSWGSYCVEGVLCQGCSHAWERAVSPSCAHTAQVFIYVAGKR